jgi:hypothetical protein
VKLSFDLRSELARLLDQLVQGAGLVLEVGDSFQIVVDGHGVSRVSTASSDKQTTTQPDGHVSRELMVARHV